MTKNLQYFILGLCAIAIISCQKTTITTSVVKSKSDTTTKKDTTTQGGTTAPTSPYELVPDSGDYLVKSGTLSITTPDTTITFTAPQDTLIFRTSYYFSRPVFYIIAAQPGGKSNMYISAAIKRQSGATSTVGDCYINEFVKSVLIHRYYTFYGDYYGGTINLDIYNTNNTLAKGSFTVKEPRDGFDYPDPANFLKITGTYDLNLNKK